MTERQIRDFIDSLNDHADDAGKCLEFLLRLQNNPLPDKPAPVLEVVSILKVDKPVLFMHLKMRAKTKQSIAFLLEIPIDYTIAKQRLLYAPI